MKTKFLPVLLILSGLLVTADKTYACDPPNADLDASPNPVCVGCSVTLDGSGSSDPDGEITKYEWDWTNDGSYDYSESPGDGIATHIYTIAGTYTAKLRVTDDDDATDTDTCQVTVVEADLDIMDVLDNVEEDLGGYVSFNDDDDDDDGVVDYDDDTNPNEDNLVEIYLSVSPSLSTGEVQLALEDFYPPNIRVWSSPTKGNMIIPNGDWPDLCYYKTWDLSKESVPETLYVEGISTGPLRGETLWLSYSREDIGCIHWDTVTFTVVNVYVVRDSSYSQVLDDWPEDGDHPRSPKYIFGEDDPIYVQVTNIGTEPYTAETFFNFVKVTSESSESADPPEPTCVYLDLQETGVNTQIFRNSEAPSELLYLSTSSSENGRENIKVIDEEVLTFWLNIQPGSDNYTTCKTVMVDRAEIGTEFQEDYHVYCGHGSSSLNTERFGGKLYDNIGGEPGLVWFKNFKRSDLDSHPEHWSDNADPDYVGSADLTSWSGHSSNCTYLHFFNESPTCVFLARADIDLGDLDAEWVIFDTCWFLDGLKDELKTALLSSNPNARSAHMFLGFATHGEDPDDWVMTYWRYPPGGEYFADRLEYVSIQQAWFDYCEVKQYRGCKARVFRVPAYASESLAGTGPIYVKRDPIASDDWKIYSYLKITSPDPPP